MKMLTIKPGGRILIGDEFHAVAFDPCMYSVVYLKQIVVSTQACVPFIKQMMSDYSHLGFDCSIHVLSIFFNMTGTSLLFDK